ncbi:MAG: DNA polymerase III subunit beta [Oscillospiraceae bacterium]|nr:DNA polymerase III subunit beta [Oscillospiraceae bacterium]
MKFQCERSILLNAVATAARAASMRNALPSMEGLLFNVDNNITITGYNMEIGIVVSLHADIQMQGAVIMPNKMLQDILRKMPDDVISFEVNDQNVIDIQCGTIAFQLPGLPASDYANLPETENEKTFTFSQATLRHILSHITYALSDNESRILNTGALFDIIGNQLNVVALDGFRMAIRKTEIEHGGEDFKFIVPGAALRELERILLEDEESILTIELGRRHIQFMMGHATLFSRLLEGEFHNYQRAIPEDYKYTVTVNARMLQTAVERVSLVIQEKIRSAVRLTINENTVAMQCKTALGFSSDVCDSQGDGEGLEIGFNNRYLLDALRTVDDDEVKLCFNGSLNPCVVLPLEGEVYLNMVLPTRLSND